ncbi:MAG: ATP-binding domain-containing protein [Lentisphaerae bacterium]|nr:ATP-binding domain-containing protein [Lentisphaerota bacterium]MBT7059625.1 ATP-binding domain-containing protein [Lentisphaerota bacterium]MBT7846854.1 ATP-binding domain-containing protein [Lentisphaerota bacterium]
MRQTSVVSTRRSSYDHAASRLRNPTEFCARRTRSRQNETTAALCCALVREALGAGTDSIAVITPYVAQARLIREHLREDGLGDTGVQCSTVHRFQGNERDIVILDTVDATPFRPGILLAGEGPHGSALNLLNVSISRARGKLVVLADVSYFRDRAPDAPISQLLQLASEQGTTVRLRDVTT